MLNKFAVSVRNVNKLTKRISNPCGVERKNAKTSKSVLSQMNKPQS